MMQLNFGVKIGKTMNVLHSLPLKMLKWRVLAETVTNILRKSFDNQTPQYNIQNILWIIEGSDYNAMNE